MSCVADANAVIQNMTKVTKNNGDELMASPLSCGSRKGRSSMAADIRICMVSIHHLLVLMISTNGLHRGLITHGR